MAAPPSSRFRTAAATPSGVRPKCRNRSSAGAEAPKPDMPTKAPSGPIKDRWTTHKMNNRLVNPANRRKLTVIIVGTGLAGGAAAATLGEAGYNVKSFCYQDSPRRAHSIAAQGGINAASEEWLRALRKRCDDVGAVLIYDEIQVSRSLSRCNVHGSDAATPYSAASTGRALYGRTRSCRSTASRTW